MELPHTLTTVTALLLAALFFAASAGLGRLLLPRSLRQLGDRRLVEIGLGSGALGYIAFGLGLVGLLRPGVLVIVLMAGAAWLAWSHATQSHAPPDLGRVPSFRAWPLFAQVVAAVAGMALGLALLGALLPEVEYDALWYHLTFPRRYLESGFLLDFPCEHMAPTPQHVELLYSYGLLLGDARSPKLIHYGFGVLAAVWAGVLAQRSAGPGWGMLAAALFLTAPTVTWEMTTAYNELPLAFTATGAVALLLEWRRTGARSLLLIAGALLGFGMAGKHLALFFLALLALGVLLVRIEGVQRRPLERSRDAALLCMLAVAVALPWYVRAFVLTGNPLFPMFYDQLTALGLEIERWDAGAQSGWSAAMARYGHGRSAADLLLLPLRAVWNGRLYDGSLGPAWLLGLPLTLLLWRTTSTEIRLLFLLVLLYVALWASPYSSFQIRYLVPLAPVAAVVLAVTSRDFARLLSAASWPRMRPLLGVLGVAVLFFNLPVFSRVHDARSGWISTTFHTANAQGLRTALGLSPHERFLGNRLESYAAIEHINERVPRDGRVVWFGEAAHFYAVPELLMDYSRCVAHGTYFSGPGDEARAHEILRAAGVTHIAWDNTRTDLEEDWFAIRSASFLDTYTERMYDDGVMEVHELLDGPRSND